MIERERESMKCCLRVFWDEVVGSFGGVFKGGSATVEFFKFERDKVVLTVDTPWNVDD